MDRKIVLAVFLMMVVAVVPSFLFKAPPRPVAPQVADSGVAGQRDSGSVGQRVGGVAAPSGAASPRPSTAVTPHASAVPVPAADSVVVTSGLYRYVFSTRGAELVRAQLLRYPDASPRGARGPVDLIRPGESLLGLALVAGSDSVPLGGWTFTPSATTLSASAGVPLTFTAAERGITVTLSYTFHPDDYRFDVQGKVTGLPATGGIVLAGLGEGIASSEADTLENGRDHALVVKPLGKSTDATPFYKVDPGTSRAIPGPFSWVASKSKYFVVGLFAPDTTQRWAAARMTVPPAVGKYSGIAELSLSQPVTAAGNFGFRVYAGPMEYNRLSAAGDDFDDVNPYGVIGFRTAIRPFALFFRQVFVWMHTALGMSYGLAIILLGVLIRLALWPINQKAMRSAMAMQAIQPHIKAMQERHKNDPARLQQEMMRLYKEHGVNPLGGCLPMLLPMPILLALFFVFQNTIEMRGAPFLWFADLARPDQLHIIPFLTGLSMLALSWLGQKGLPPNPQAKMMMWMAPVMFTFFGFRFAAGLNLYYVMSNIASLPQQWLIGRERARRAPPTPVETAKRK
jgi:YidC/Oxa1 family membrane protein insertase